MRFGSLGVIMKQSSNKVDSLADMGKKAPKLNSKDFEKMADDIEKNGMESIIPGINKVAESLRKETNKILKRE